MALEQSRLIGPVAHLAYSRKWHHTTASCGGFLITLSDYRMLPPATRAAVFAEIAQAIDRQSGAFDLDYETHLYTARRLECD